jgi:hypothetical protein
MSNDVVVQDSRIAWLTLVMGVALGWVGLWRRDFADGNCFGIRTNDGALFSGGSPFAVSLVTV